jgi:hypothetical protein
MLLSSTTDLVTADTTSTADVVFIVEYAIGDKTTSPMVIKDADTKVTVSTTIQAALDISGSPAAANDRWQINRLRAINYHASASNSVEIKYKKGAATARRVKKATLLAGETLEMDKNGVWFKYTSEVGVYQAAAIPGTRVVLASGSAATYTTHRVVAAAVAEVAVIPRNFFLHPLPRTHIRSALAERPELLGRTLVTTALILPLARSPPKAVRVVPASSRRPRRAHLAAPVA